MFYVVLSIGAEVMYETHVLGIFTEERLADAACQEAQAAWERRHRDEGWRSRYFEVCIVPELNVSATINYDWTPFGDEPMLRWGLPGSVV